MLALATAVLLAGPTALAFFSGGYFEEPRVWAGLGAWLLVAIGLVAGGELPRGRIAWLAIGSIALLAGWTLLSRTWAPIAGSAYQAAQIVVLYTGVLLAAAILLRHRAARRAVEPALAAGALIVVGYGISERLLPGILHFARSLSAEGRLEQPLTYWNAMGELAAIGFVLCARLAGDLSRAGAMRALAVASTAPLGLGLYLSISRGALFACAAGLIALVVAAPRREQLQAVVLCVSAGTAAALVAATMSGLSTISGSLSSRETQGAIMLVVLVALGGGAALALRMLERRKPSAELRLPRGAPLIAAALIGAGLALAIVIGAKESSKEPVVTAGVSRYATLQSDRYAYWSVALHDFESQPLHGVGAGGWAVDWLRYRKISTFAQDAHSLPLQTLAELGLVGLALLIGFVAGIALAMRNVRRASAPLAAGAIAGFVVWLAHAPLDWDWQMPAVTVPALVLAGLILAAAGDRTPDGAAQASAKVAANEPGAQRRGAPAASSPGARHTIARDISR